jgi:hypothetical protein
VSREDFTDAQLEALVSDNIALRQRNEALERENERLTRELANKY